MGKDEDIFSDDFVENESQQKDVTDEKDFVPPPKPPKEEPEEEYAKPKGASRKKQSIIGLGIFVGVGLLIFLALTGMIDIVDSEPFDASQCNFGVVSELFSERCMTEDEYIIETEATDISDNTPEPTTPPSTTTTSPPEDNEPFKDVSSTSDKVEVQKTSDPIGYYMVTTDDDWYGDFVDIRKIPSKIEKLGDMKVNFRCYTDEFQGTSTYFGTFRNVIDGNLSVEVFINGKKVDSQSTTSNKALILEGSCYGN